MWQEYAVKLRYYLGFDLEAGLATVYNKLRKNLSIFIDNKDDPVFKIPAGFFDGPPQSDLFNDILNRFNTDMGVLECVDYNSKIVAVHNNFDSAFKDLDLQADRLKNLLLSNDVFADLRRRLKVVENFTSLDMVGDETTASVDISSGTVTLQRSKGLLLNDKVQRIDVDWKDKDKYPRRKKFTDGTVDGLDIFYEGKLYGKEGDTWPEGGIWRFDVNPKETFELNSVSFSSSARYLAVIPKKYFVKDGELFVIFEKDGYLRIYGSGSTKALATLKHGSWHFGGYLKSMFGVSTMTDAELTTTAGAKENKNNLTVKEIMAQESGLTDYSMFKITLKESTDEDLQNARKVMLDDNPVTAWQCEINKKVIYKELSVDVPAGKEASNPPTEDVTPQIDLEVYLTFTFDEPVVINWITIDPLTFDEAAPVYVKNIEYSEYGTEEWEQIPGFIDLTLTENLNRVVDDYRLGLMMSDNRYEFRGKGIWTFSAIRAKKIRVTLYQNKGYNEQFDVYKLQLGYQVDSVYNNVTTSISQTRTLTLPYFHTLAILEGDLDLRSQYTETQPTTLTSTTTKTNSGFLGFFAKSKTSTFSLSSSGMHLINQWLASGPFEVKRYAIGIRDVDFRSYKYAEDSEFYTTTFESPEPISEITLESFDFVPPSFPDGRWIRYYVQIKDKWYEIGPINKGYEGVPTRIRIGGYKVSGNELLLPYDDVYKVRVKAVLSRPKDNDVESPKIFRYILNLYPNE